MHAAPAAVRIREAELTDVDALYQLTHMKGVKEALPGIMKNWLEDDIVHRLQGSRRHHILVAECDGQMVGYTRFLHRLRPEKDGRWQTTGHETAVHPMYRGQGIGQALVEARLADTLAYHEAKPSYIAFKAPADIAANRFHQAQGAKIIGTQTETSGRVTNLYQLDLAPYRAAVLSENMTIASKGMTR